MDSEPITDPLLEKAIQARPPFKTSIVELESVPIDQDTLRESIKKTQQGHLIEGHSLVSDSGIPVVFIQIPKYLNVRKCDRAPLTTCLSTFGAGLIVGALCSEQSSFFGLSTVFSDDNAFAPLCNCSYYAVIVQGNRPTKSFYLEYPDNEQGRAASRLLEQAFSDYQVTFPNKTLFICDGFPDLKQFYRQPTKTELLQKSWAAAFYAYLNIISDRISANKEDIRRSTLSDVMMSKYIGFFDTLTQSNFDIPKVLDYFLDLVDKPRGLEDLWFTSNQSYNPLELNNTLHPELHALFVNFSHLALLSPALTKTGTEIPCLVPWGGGRIAHAPIDPKDFSEEDALTYWFNLPDNLPVNWHLFISPQEQPFNPKGLAESFSNVKLEGSIDEVDQQTDSLLKEAVANKYWIIPPGARIEINFGCIRYAELFEQNNIVYVFFRDQEDRYQTAVVDASASCIELGIFYLSSDEDQSNDIRAALKLLLAAIIRDFWVLEEREKAFSQGRVLSEEQSNNHRSEKTERIIYIPRVKYSTTQPNASAVEQSLDLSNRTQHYVSSHLRKVTTPSPHQLILAEKYGFSVPEGYTFVRPHFRGNLANEAKYRSRSALQLLFHTLETPPSSNTPQWFKFERDVYSFMKSEGYTVEHTAVPRSGDHGVDVFAEKKTRDGFISWVIQCKCYSPHRKVGPSTIRELIGTLSLYQENSKGMVITTSSFTPGAIREADQAGIALIDGKQFLRELNDKQ